MKIFAGFKLKVKKAEIEPIKEAQKKINSPEFSTNGTKELLAKV
jgi:hypothetical protein